MNDYAHTLTPWFSYKPSEKVQQTPEEGCEYKNRNDHNISDRIMIIKTNYNQI